eukprot:6206562-Pleurochrysis_carterae.AAC.1
MRRTPVVSLQCPVRFMTPVGVGAAEALGARQARATSGWSSAGATGPSEASVSSERRHRALPEASRVKATSPPSRAKRALRAESGTSFCSASASAAASAARESPPRLSCFEDGLSPLDLRLGQSLCQWDLLHQRQGAHLSLHFSLGSGRGRLGSAVFERSSLLRTAKACAEFGLSSSSRRTLRASASLRTLRAAPMVSARSPTPELRDNLTSSSVDR